MEGSIQKRIEWIEKRTPLSDMAKHYIAFQMQLYAEYYHEQQVKSVDLADVGGSLPTQQEFLKTIIDWHEECQEKGYFNIPLVHEQYEYLTWLSNRLAKVHGQ
jgi:hypothetical protein